jgi:hypothetical protein
MDTQMDGHAVSYTNEFTLFDETYYSSWRIKMKGYLKSKGAGVWDTIFSGSNPSKKQSKFEAQKEAKKNNVVELNTILNGFLGYVKEIIGQFTPTKDLWLKLEKEYQDSNINESKKSPKSCDLKNSKCNDVECSPENKKEDLVEI